MKHRMPLTRIKAVNKTSFESRSCVIAFFPTPPSPSFLPPFIKSLEWPSEDTCSLWYVRNSAERHEKRGKMGRMRGDSYFKSDVQSPGKHSVRQKEYVAKKGRKEVCVGETSGNYCILGKILKTLFLKCLRVKQFSKRSTELCGCTLATCPRLNLFITKCAQSQVIIAS